MRCWVSSLSLLLQLRRALDARQQSLCGNARIVVCGIFACVSGLNPLVQRGKGASDLNATAPAFVGAYASNIVDVTCTQTCWLPVPWGCSTGLAGRISVRCETRSAAEFRRRSFRSRRQGARPRPSRPQSGRRLCGLRRRRNSNSPRAERSEFRGWLRCLAVNG